MRRPRILELRPTQFVLGIREIESKVEKMAGFSKKELEVYCDRHQIPVVIGPKEEFFIIDHHHFTRACWEQNVDLYSVKVVEDLSRLDEKAFWNTMIQKEWVYLHDQFGLGPHSPRDLPADIRCLADDPFRSLVWDLLNSGEIKKQDVPFFEFKWSAFLRFNLDMELHSKSNFKRAVSVAQKLVRSKAARGLPGFQKT